MCVFCSPNSRIDQKQRTKRWTPARIKPATLCAEVRQANRNTSKSFADVLLKLAIPRLSLVFLEIIIMIYHRMQCV
ncbi:hypothetical protein L596_000412 [Steinernema carpocapsae]|uniref:Uncharacterized protein n=1 Tax=Steinernema carpocapsae TaxID=34508 RepID=A0A4V6I738_STECR|nr:hypothetical protein L596_000412 [Steinernema carpocapsae]